MADRSKLYDNDRSPKKKEVREAKRGDVVKGDPPDEENEEYESLGARDESTPEEKKAASDSIGSRKVKDIPDYTFNPNAEISDKQHKKPIEERELWRRKKGVPTS